MEKSYSHCDTVLFDLDGTLLYTLPDIHLALNHVLELHGFPLRAISETRSFVGGGVKRLLERALPPGTQELESLCREYTEYYGLHAQDHLDYYPGIREFVTALRKRGIHTGVVTNKPHAAAVAMISRFFGDEMDITMGKTEGCPAKPSPECLLQTMDALGAQKEKTLYIGDSPIDAETAANAGIACMLVSWGYSDRPALEASNSLGIFNTPAALLDGIIALMPKEEKGETSHAF